MTLSFQSFRSSSSGNCLALWSGETSILFDFGVRSLRDCRALLGGHQEAHGPVDAVLISHSHGDHCSRDALRVLGNAGIDVRAHPHVVPLLRARHDRGTWTLPPVHAFSGNTFSVGDFDITAVALPHAPDIPNFGFVVRAGHGTDRRTVVIATDFHDAAPLLPYLPGADFLFVEANHDLELLRQHFNPNSRYHLNNVKTASLLCQAVREGGFAPAAVVLGHLSDERNREQLATDEVHRAFRAHGLRVPFVLETAPKFAASRVFRIA
jgi:ribonuclease BN (tRNA processing enzyme)